MRRKWMIEQRVRGQNQRAKKVGACHDLTVVNFIAIQVTLLSFSLPHHRIKKRLSLRK